MNSLKSTHSSFVVTPFTAFVAFVVPCVLLFATVLNVQSDDPFRCYALKDEGRWLDVASKNGSHTPYKNWQSQDCITHQYNPGEITQCVGDQKIVFAGDSTARQVYWAVARKLNSTLAQTSEANAPKHADQNFTSSNVRLEFIWDPYLNSSRLENELWTYAETRSQQQTNQSSPALILLGAGAWFGRWFDSAHSFPRFQLAIENVTTYTRSHDPPFSGITSASNEEIFDRIFFMPVPIPVYDRLEGLRKDNILQGEMEKMNDYLQTLGRTSSVLWSYLAMTDQQPDSVDHSGLHVHESVADARADILLNLRCNTILDRSGSYPIDRSCCSKYQSTSQEQQVILALGILLSLYLLWNIALSKEQSTISSALLFTFTSLAYCYFADRTHLFAKAKKYFIQEEYNILSGIVLLAGMLSIRRSGKPNTNGIYKDQPFLSRDQTEEWKGWMQFAILIYHYTNASAILPIYQGIRLMVAAYLFLTGFGHTCYFLRKSDFSFRRVAKVLVRLNLLSCMLPYVMGTNYLSYYFAPLVTFWFSMVYVTMRIYASKNGNTMFVASKIVIGAIAVTIILHTPIFDVVFSLLKSIFRIEWDVHEWKFRLQLDRYIVFIGMLVALAFERYNTAATSGIPTPSFNLVRVPSLVLSLVAIPAMYNVFSAFPSKTDSNIYHPYLSFIPILAFMTLRNGTQTARNYHSTIFAWLGTFSLETFVLQYHIWLAGDTKGLLSLGIFHSDGSVYYDRWRNLVILTPVFFWVSWKLAAATGTLTEAILYEGEVEDMADGEALLGNGLLSEKIQEPGWSAGTIKRIKDMLWPKVLGARLSIVLLGIWGLNMLW